MKKVNGNDICKIRIIHEFLVLHNGWEGDNRGWVLEYPDGGRSLETTNHGLRCRMGMTELKNKIKETKKSLEELEKALDLMKAVDI